LTQFGNLLAEIFRESDVIGRLGEDEFVVFLTNTAKSESSEVATRLDAAVNAYNLASQRGYNLAFNTVAVEYDAEMHHSIGELLQEADTLMYQSKKQNREV
jgi:diguanylate cyclase (GGDEF)-like protein